MNKKILLFLLPLTLGILSSCDNGQNAALQAQVDSLTTALEQRNADYNLLDQYITVISTGLDSIYTQENDIFNADIEKQKLTPQQLKESLATLKQTLQNQKVRIAQLEKQLTNDNESARKMRAIIISLKAQLTEKESQISDLQKALEKSNLKVDDLITRMTHLSRITSDQSEYIREQNQLIKKQGDLINEAYVKIGTKAELKEAGMLKGGFLKKTKVDYSNIDKSQFKTIDTRTVTEIEIDSPDPKILTEVPEGSYSLSKYQNKTTLIILDPARFWNVSKFLIIQKD